MDDPSTLREKATRYFAKAASSPTADEAEKLNGVARQLELWADDLEEMLTRRGGTKPQDGAGAKQSESQSMKAGARTHS